MSDRPRASIVITTHNRPKLVRRAIASALAQTLGDVEVLVVDDGSRPAFPWETGDARVRVIRRERAGGPSAARNTGIAEARGTWITFLDDDDELTPDMLERSLAAAERSDLPAPVAAMSAVTVIDVDGNTLDTLVPATLQRGEHFFLERRGAYGRASNSLVIPTDVMRAIGGFDDELAVFQHDDLGLRLNAVASIVALAQPLYRMTDHGEPRVSARGAAIPDDMEQTLAKHPEAFAHHRDGHARYMSTLALYHLKTGNWRAAMRWSTRAVARDPRQPRVWAYAAAAVGGPSALGALRTVRRSIGPSGEVPWWTLTKRRLRKYSRRLLAYPRAFVAWPIAWASGALIRRRRPALASVRREPVLILSVYREGNARTVARVVADAAERGWEVRLWALDRPHPSLTAHTVGSGRGTRLPLLNALVRDDDLDRFEWVVVVDDDVVLRAGALGVLLSVAEHAGLDVVQPSHTARSHHTFEISVRRPLAVARRTTFVESGPAFAIRRPWAARCVPFPADHEMGWGIELDWYDLAEQGACLGIVDAVAARHLHPIGGGYRRDRETERLERRLRERGLTALRDVQQTLGVWRPWQRQPPWSPGNRSRSRP